MTSQDNVLPSYQDIYSPPVGFAWALNADGTYCTLRKVDMIPGKEYQGEVFNNRDGEIFLAVYVMKIPAAPAQAALAVA